MGILRFGTFFILPEVFYIEPFSDLDLCLVWLGTLVNLQEIAERVVFIIAAQRKQAAETGAGFVDGTAPART